MGQQLASLLSIKTQTTSPGPSNRLGPLKMQTSFANPLFNHHISGVVQGAAGAAEGGTHSSSERDTGDEHVQAQPLPGEHPRARTMTLDASGSIWATVTAQASDLPFPESVYHGTLAAMQWSV